MLKKAAIATMNDNIRTIVMTISNITNYLDLYNYDVDCYKTMDDYILTNYNYELFGKNVYWPQLDIVDCNTIHYFIPEITISSHDYNIYYEVIDWIQNKEYYKLMSFYALSISYEIISANRATIKMLWFNNDKTCEDVNTNINAD